MLKRPTASVNVTNILDFGVTQRTSKRSIHDAKYYKRTIKINLDNVKRMRPTWRERKVSKISPMWNVLIVSTNIF